MSGRLRGSPPVITKTGRPNLRMESQPLTPELLRSADAVVIATDHTAYDYAWIVEHAQLVVGEGGGDDTSENNAQQNALHRILRQSFKSSSGPSIAFQ